MCMHAEANMAVYTGNMYIQVINMLYVYTGNMYIVVIWQYIEVICI